MKKLSLLLAGVLALTACKEKKDAEAVAESTEITEEAVQSEWKVLFDGTSFDGWKGYNQEGMPDAWAIEEGAMVLTPPNPRPEGANYNIVTEEKYSNFVLSLEWKIAEGGNSGVFWGVEELEKFGQPYATGPEIQVLDNERHPDAKAGTSHQAGALYDMVSPSENVCKPAGEWNLMEITIDYANHAGKVALNGTEIVNFPLGNQEWDDMVAGSKFNGWEGFGAYSTGKIGLQDHGDKVSYRNIKIKAL
ncbi:MAG: hypothetical protein RLZZ241_1655 [Bacteroidota bacterium]|jgi:hypothetical protein